MKRKPRHRWPFPAAVVSSLLIVMLVAAPVWAASAEGTEWRETYDLVMRWVNFLILAGALVYFGRRPVVNLLRSQAARHEGEIQRLEAEKAAILERLEAVRRNQTENEARFIELTEKIVATGEAQRDALIADAQRESEMLIAEARRRISFAMRSAKDRLRAEMVDLAVDSAIARLPQEITAADNQHRLGVFIDGLEKMH